MQLVLVYYSVPTSLLIEHSLSSSTRGAARPWVKQLSIATAAGQLPVTMCMLILATHAADLAVLASVRGGVACTTAQNIQDLISLVSEHQKTDKLIPLLQAYSTVPVAKRF